MNATLARFPRIDYRSHPAFKGLGDGSGAWNESAIDQLLLEIDQELDRLVSATLEPDAVAGEFARRIAPILLALRTEVAKGTPDDPLTMQWLLSSIENMQPQLLTELQCSRARLRQPKRVPRNAAALAQLERDGFVRVELPHGATERWHDQCLGFRRTLLNRAEKNPNARQWLALPVFGQLAREMVRVLHSVGAIEVAAAYRRHPMELEHLSLHYSHPRQRWYQGCYEDIGLPTSPMAYLHNDHEPAMVKMIVYLSPVTEAAGPFKYMQGSHLWPRSMARHVLFKQLDRQHPKLFKTQDCDGYYRPSFKLPIERARFMTLPTAFQGTSHFGDDLTSDHPDLQALQDCEVSVVDDAAVIVFDGGRGLHRGSLLNSGERWAIQLGFRFKPRRSLVRHGGRFLRRVIAIASRVP